jgi:hypothetical protein
MSANPGEAHGTEAIPRAASAASHPSALSPEQSSPGDLAAVFERIDDQAIHRAFIARSLRFVVVR